VLPNDEQECERLDLQNHLFSLTLEGKLHLAPLDPKTLHSVLDIGTGTGIWAIDFAELYPQAKITGTDLSPVQPKFIPSNVQFEICDAEEEWLFSTKFNYIHGRMLTVCFRDVKEVFRNAFEALRPGGWLEMQDANAPARSDDGSTEGTALVAWWDNLIEAGKAMGRPFGTEPPNYARYMEEVGFVDVHVEVRRWPFGPWTKESRKMRDIGLWARANHIDALQATAMAVLTRGTGRTRQEVEAELVAVRKDLMNPAIHSYMPM
jgi:SAM-dependent methyltransferase